MKIIKSLEESGLLIKAIAETVENEIKEQKEGFLGMLAAILGASILGKILSVRGVLRVRGVVMQLFEREKELLELVKNRIFNAASSFN